MLAKQQRFYTKIMEYYQLDSIEDAKRIYTAYNQLKKIETPHKATKIDDMLTRLYANKSIVE